MAGVFDPNVFQHPYVFQTGAVENPIGVITPPGDFVLASDDNPCGRMRLIPIQYDSYSAPSTRPTFIVKSRVKMKKPEKETDFNHTRYIGKKIYD